MKRIKLTHGKWALVDNDMHELLSKTKWYAKDDVIIYAAKSTHRSSINPGVVDGTEYMHWYIIGKPGRGFVVDHINGNGLDNRRENLRIVSQRRNQANSFLHRRGRLAGIARVNKSKKWQARIEINGKCKYLGVFTTRIRAHEAYMGAVKIIEGLECKP